MALKLGEKKPKSKNENPDVVTSKVKETKEQLSNVKKSSLMKPFKGNTPIKKKVALTPKRFNSDSGLSLDNSKEILSQRSKFIDEEEEKLNTLNSQTDLAKPGEKSALTANVEPADKSGGSKRKSGISLSEKQKAKNKKYRNLTFKMYSYKIFNWLLQGALDKRDPNLTGSQIQIGYSSVITKATITRYYSISYLPEETPVALYNHIKQAFNNANYWVKVSMQMSNRPFFVDLSKAGIQLKLLRWSQQLDEAKQGNETGEVEGADGSTYVTDIGQSNQHKFIKRMFRSYFKIRDNNRHLNETTFIVKVQTRDEADMFIANETVIDMLDKYNLDYKPMTGKLLDFLRTFSIVSKQRKVSYNSTPRVLLTNRDLADLTPVKQGKIGWWGIFFGIDKFSGCSVWIDLMRSSDAKNILVTAITGFGKSFYLSFQLMFHKAVGNRIFIQDYKGNEFVDFTKSVGGLVVSQTPSKTSYINKWRIPTSGDYSNEELRAMYTESVGLSMIEFMTIVDPRPDEKKAATQIFNDFQRFVHDKVGLEPNNVSTYYKTEQITPEFLYECYESFSGPQSAGIIDMYGHRLLLTIKNDLYNYWHRNGSRHELFENEINMDEVLSADVVCFDFGMNTVTENSVPENELKLKQLNYETVSSRYTSYNKRKELTTVKVTEEIQSADEDLLKFTAADIAKGRSKNMINYILGNSSGVLFQDNRYSKTIRDGINIMILGKMHESSMSDYIKEFRLEDVREDLERISTKKEYKRCFLLHCTMTEEPITTVVQMVATPEVAESSYFRTVDHEGNKGVGIE